MHPKYPEEQYWLPGIDRWSRDRLFLALLPDRAAAMRTGETARCERAENGLMGKPIAPDRFHVTVHFLGDHPGLPRMLLKTISAAVATVAGPPFRIGFDRVGSFRHRGKRPLVLCSGKPAAPLMWFHHELGQALAREGLGRWVSRGFTPHMTLLYDESCVAFHDTAPVAWVVREFVLLHSRLGETQHSLMGRWPLD